MEATRPTITDVARRAGVSKGLVSFALNNRAGVSADTRRRILDAIDQLGWTPSAPARQLSLRASFALGLVVRRDPRVIAADPFFPAFIGGVESVLADQQRTLVLSVVASAEAERRAYQRMASERRVDGVFLTDLRVRDLRVRMLSELGVPAVMVGRPAAAVAGPRVTIDDEPGVEEAVRHLVGLGHRTIAHVGGAPHLVHGRSRRDAFTRTMTEAGLRADLVEPTDFSAAAGAIATRRLLARRRRPTAIVYASDPMAITGLGALTAAGRRVPDDVSVVGFDGAEIGAHLHPSLSTVTSDPYGWGAVAARVLLQLVDHGSADDLDLPPARFLARDSSGPAPT